MENKTQAIHTALVELEQLLQSADLWSQNPPSPQAMASLDPFCCDAMNLEAWLQWIFIPRIRQLLAENQPLPPNCNISAYAEETIGKMANTVSLMAHLKYIDSLFAR